MRTAAGPRRSLPGGLIGMVALVLLSEGWLARNELHIGNVAAREWGLSAKAVPSLARGAELLCVGDSLMLAGVQPRVLRERLGRTGYNLAVPAGQASTTYFLFRRALEAGARPRAVLVDFAPYFLATGPDRVIDRWPKLLSVHDAIDLGWTCRDASLAGRLLAARWLPSLRNRFELRTSVRLALAGAAFSTAETYLVYARNRRSNDGAIVAARRTGPEPDVNPGDLLLMPRQTHVRGVNRAYVRRFLELARARGVAVYWVLAPYLPGVAERRERLGAEAGFTRFVREMQARYPNVTVVDARGSRYPASVFSDILHLDRDGASVLSRDLADVLERTGAPGDSRWFELPAFREPESGPDLEDFEQSRLAIREAWRSRRR